MTKTRYLAAFAVASALSLGGASARAETLSNLLTGTSLTQGDVVFDNFFFEDFFDSETPFAGDRPVAAPQVEVTTSAVGSNVTLTVGINPTISISGEASPGLEHIFEFFLDFTVSVQPPSSREIVGATLGDGDLFATGDGLSEVIYTPGGFGSPIPDLAIFEDPLGSPTSVTQSSGTFAATTAIRFEGLISGLTFAGGTAGLSTYSLTFDLTGTPPPPPPSGVIPLPASVLLLLAGLGGLGLVARRRRA